MNKEQFCTILECALLSFDGVTETELIVKYNLNPKIVRIGNQLYFYLKSKQIKVQNENIKDSKVVL